MLNSKTVVFLNNNEYHFEVLRVTGPEKHSSATGPVTFF